MSEKQIAFLTLERREGFFIDDELTVPALQQYGWSVVEVPWNASGVNWSSFAAVVIRSTWDYQQHRERFLGTLAEIEQTPALLLNSLETVRWNIEKTYLQQLEQAGVPVVPTLWCRDLDVVDINAARDRFQTETVIGKPVVGANADGVFRFQKHGVEATVSEAQAIYGDQLVMLQPFVDSVVETGECSLIYFAGAFSHCVRKSPASNDFRVQEEHGGRVTAAHADGAMRAVADRALDALPFPTLYARVDLVQMQPGTWVVIELELIEPSLYYRYDPAAPERFATALHTRIGSP